MSFSAAHQALVGIPHPLYSCIPPCKYLVQFLLKAASKNAFSLVGFIILVQFHPRYHASKTKWKSKNESSALGPKLDNTMQDPDCFSKPSFEVGVRVF